MSIIKDVIEFIFSAALFINAILFIPQAVRIYKEKAANGVSLITFTGFFLIQVAIILHAIIVKDYLLMGGYILSLLTCGAVIFLILLYRKNGMADVTFEEILDQLPGHIYWKNERCVLVGCNKNNWKDFGLKSLSQFIGKTDYDLFSKEEADHLRMVDEEVMRNDVQKVVEEEATTGDGKKRLYLSYKAPLKNKKEKTVGVLGCSVDITDIKQDTLDRLAMLENIIAVMPGNVYWMDKNGIYLGCNDNEAKAVGLSSRKEIVGKRNIDMPGFVIPEAIDPVNEKVFAGETVTVEEPAILSNGEQAVFLSNKVPICNSQNKIVGMVGISFDITERKKTEKELEKTKEIAESANNAKTEFLMNMKHDLRTPFSGILGIAEFLESKETDLKKKENLSYITQSAKILLDHLNEIFEYIHLDSGQLPVLEKQFDLGHLLNGVYSMMLPSAKSKGIEFTTSIDDSLPQFVIGDRIRTQRILMNLLANAIKFTNEGHVSLLVTLGKKENKKIIVKFTVEDTGVGIQEEKMNLIFEKFNRLTSSYSGVYPGKGLGLSIVKHFLDELGGEAHVESEMGKGSVFKILIPYKEPLLNCSEENL